jgi:hypothetical protein
MYRLDNRFTNIPFAVTVVGCGGTGGYVAEGLCRLLPAHADLALVDYDRVEERNLCRQAFTRDELGAFKSEALARRLAREFGRPVSYSTLPIAAVTLKLPGLIVGCVDNGLARGDIAKAKAHPHPYGSESWWIDAGNGENYGQVLIGNCLVATACKPEDGIYYNLPLPTLQRPELLRQLPRARGCADIDGQGPTINLSMAAIVIEVVRRLIAGTCPWLQLYLDMENGTLVPVFATPRTVGEIFKKRGKEVSHERREEERPFENRHRA